MGAPKKPRKRHKRLWATTTCCSWDVQIYITSSPRFKLEGETQAYENRACFITIAEEVFNNPYRFNVTLCHELTHVAEAVFKNDKAMFDPTVVDGCTALVATMGACLGEMLTHLTQLEPRP